MTIHLTTPPPGGRGCGVRKPGAVYACLGVGPDGIPWHELLFDPAVPYTGDQFRGVHEAPPELAAGWPRVRALLLDMVGLEHYPTVPSFVEELRRFGLSRQVPATFDWPSLGGREPWLALVHWRGAHAWPDGTEELPALPYETCKHRARTDLQPVKEAVRIANYEDRRVPIATDHYADCVYHLWPLSVYEHGQDDEGRVAMPGFSFDPLNVAGPLARPWWTDMPPKPSYSAAAFAAVPITHLEAVQYVPEGCRAAESGLPIVLMEE